MSDNLIDRISVRHLKDAYLLVWSQLVGDSKRLERLSRAFDILAKDSAYSIEITSIEKNAQMFLVHGPNDSYRTSMKECSCLDNALICKHRLAIRLLREAFILKNREKRDRNA